MTKCRRMDVLACHFGIGALFLEARIEWGMPNPWFIAVLLLLIGIAIYGYLRERRHWHSVAWTAALVMRILALAVVGLILSPTALRLQSATATKPIVHVLIDNSHSIVIPASDNQVGKGIRALFEQNGALNLRQLSNATKVHLWAFDKSLYALSAEKLSKLQWDGSESKLLNALNEIIDRIPQSNPQPTIIVITDGQDTTMGEISRMQIATLAQRARGHANFIIVGVGRKKQPSNVKIELTPRYAISFPNAIITIQAVARLVQGDRYQGKLTITRGTRIIAQRDIALDANQREAQVDIDIMPRRGANVIKARCSVASDETLIEDNVAFGVIDVINRNLRLLYLEGAPRWEYKFTKRAFEDDDGIDLLSLVQKPSRAYYAQGNLVEREQALRLRIDRDMLRKFDIVIIGNISARELSPRILDNLEWFVAEHGGALLMLGGERALGLGGYERTPLVKLLPVRLDECTIIRKPYHLIPTALGRYCPAIRLGKTAVECERAWRALPPLKFGLMIGTAKAGAQVLLEYPTSVAPSNRRAALIWHAYGAGRVAVMAPFDTWRWWMAAGRENREPREFTHFWRQLVRYLAMPRPPNAVNLWTDKALYDVMESIVIRARAHGSVTALEHRTIEVEAVDAHGRRKRGKLNKVGNMWMGQMRLNRPGHFVIRPHGINGNATMVTVIEHLMERQRCGRNEKFLRELATRLRGQYVGLEDAQRFFASYQWKVKTTQIEYHVRLHSLPVAYIILAVLLCLEWFLRRRNGLV